MIVKDQVTGKLQRVQAKAGGAVLTTYAGTELAQHPVASPNGLYVGAVNLSKATIEYQAIIPLPVPATF